jgi:hypothetical protein
MLSIRYILVDAIHQIFSFLVPGQKNPDGSLITDENIQSRFDNYEATGGADPFVGTVQSAHLQRDGQLFDEGRGVGNATIIASFDRTVWLENKAKVEAAPPEVAKVVAASTPAPATEPAPTENS